MRKYYFIFAILSFFLTACGSNPVNYLPVGTTPIVNIEADIAEDIDLIAKQENLVVINLAHMPINIAYKIFWYDKNGVTQSYESNSDSSEWLMLRLDPQQKQQVNLVKPTLESSNYRIYVRGLR